MVFNGATYTGGALFNTASSGVYGVAARPLGSTGNFWSVGAGQTGTVTFDKPVSYFGFLWGSPDQTPWNTLTVTTVDKVLHTYDGTMISATNTWDKTGYFNITSRGQGITSIAFSASQNAFETDNHSFIAATVPEPETLAMLLAGLGMMGMIARRRKTA
jgi:hypothetical protein